MNKNLSKKINYKTIARILKYVFKEHKILFVVALLMMTVSSITSVVGNYLLKPLVDDYITPNIGATNPNLKPMFTFIIVIAVFYIVSCLSQYISMRSMVNISNDTLQHIRDDLFIHVQHMHIGRLDKSASGDIMSEFTNDTNAIRIFLSQSVPQIFTSSLTIIGLIIAMFVLSWLLAIITVISLVIMFLIVAFVTKRSSKYFVDQQKYIGAVNGYIEELTQGQKVVKVFSYEERNKAIFNKMSNDLRKSSSRAYVYTNFAQPIATNLAYANYILVAVVGAWLMLDPRFKSFSLVTIGVLMVYLQFTKMINQPIMQISDQIYSVVLAQAGADRIFDTMKETQENLSNGYMYNVEEIDGNKYFVNTADGSKLEFKGKVEFRDVHFSYEPGKEILKGISFTAMPGEKIAFVGSTGAGKTTIISLVNRFYDIDSGEILIDGIDIKDINLEQLRLLMAYVLQDTHLFTDSVKNNIKYANDEITDEEVEKASKIANLHPFVKFLENGYDTIINGLGGQLSQGQRQLLSIARATATNRLVLFLDEATSSVDTRTERLIQEGLKKLMDNKTVFIIAHRLSTIKNADKIIVLDHGCIIEEGKHKELLALKGVYYQLCAGIKELA